MDEKEIINMFNDLKIDANAHLDEHYADTKEQILNERAEKLAGIKSFREFFGLPFSTEDDMIREILDTYSTIEGITDEDLIIELGVYGIAFDMMMNKSNP